MLNAARNLKIHFIFIGFIFMSYGYPAMADQTCPKVGDVYTGLLRLMLKECLVLLGYVNTYPVTGREVK